MANCEKWNRVGGQKAEKKTRTALLGQMGTENARSFRRLAGTRTETLPCAPHEKIKLKHETRLDLN